MPTVARPSINRAPVPAWQYTKPNKYRAEQLLETEALFSALRSVYVKAKGYVRPKAAQPPKLDEFKAAMADAKDGSDRDGAVGLKRGVVERIGRPVRANRQGGKKLAPGISPVPDSMTKPILARLTSTPEQRLAWAWATAWRTAWAKMRLAALIRQISTRKPDAPRTTQYIKAEAYSEEHSEGLKLSKVKPLVKWSQRLTL